MTDPARWLATASPEEEERKLGEKESVGVRGLEHRTYWAEVRILASRPHRLQALLGPRTDLVLSGAAS
jgi:hypothetical protein